MSGKMGTAVTWILSVLVGALLLLAGVSKLFGNMTGAFRAWGYAGWFSYVIGALEAAGGIGLFIPRLARPASIGLILVMAGAAFTHLANAEGMRVLWPLFLAALLGAIYWLRGRKDRPGTDHRFSRGRDRAPEPPRP